MDPSAYALHDDVEARHWWFAARRRILAKVAGDLQLPPRARIIELGSGTGGNLAMLATFGGVVAVEPSAEAAARAARKAPDCTHVATLDDVRALGPFDAAFALDVLEHLDDPRAVLEQLHARLAPGARLVVTVPAHPWLYGDHDRYLHHVQRYTRRALARDLEGGGFRVEALSPMNAVALGPAIAARAFEAARRRFAPGHAAARGMGIPPAPLNALLEAAFAIERVVLPRRAIPFGLSLLAVAAR
jgi:SAM-dependent methyltransferase